MLGIVLPQATLTEAMLYPPKCGFANGAPHGKAFGDSHPLGKDLWKWYWEPQRCSQGARVLQALMAFALSVMIVTEFSGNKSPLDKSWLIFV